MIVSVFEGRIAPFSPLVAVNECQSRTLAAMRDVPLSRLISGEIRVLVAERNEEEKYG